MQSLGRVADRAASAVSALLLHLQIHAQTKVCIALRVHLLRHARLRSRCLGVGLRPANVGVSYHSRPNRYGLSCLAVRHAKAGEYRWQLHT